MAFVAQSDQVLFRVVAGVAAKFLVMDFKVSHRSTELASPAIPPQHTFSYLPVISFSTSCRNSSFGIARALCNQVAQSKLCPFRLRASFASSRPLLHPTCFSSRFTSGGRCS